MLESIIKGERTDVPADIEPVLDGYYQWREKSGIAVRWLEIPVYSIKHGYARSVDAIGLRGSQLIALDWKTSNNIWPSYAMQTSAYAMAISEMSGLSVTEAWAVRLGKKHAGFKARKVADLEATFSGFLGTLTLWHVLRGDVWVSFKDG